MNTASGRVQWDQIGRKFTTSTKFEKCLGNFWQFFSIWQEFTLVIFMLLSEFPLLQMAKYWAILSHLWCAYMAYIDTCFGTYLMHIGHSHSNLTIVELARFSSLWLQLPEVRLAWTLQSTIRALALFSQLKEVSKLPFPWSIVYLNDMTVVRYSSNSFKMGMPP